MEQTEKILSKANIPFCPGCGHSICVRSISESLEQLGFGSKDVVLVSDIGCCGLVDPLFATHTIHGLHGRSPALGVGVSLGLNDPNKKVVVIQGDGGATIGLQHILEAARRNIDMTLIVFNNLLFGMTGGQMSGLSTGEFKDFKDSTDDVEPYDIVNLSHQAGAAFSARVNDIANFTNVLKEAITTTGFSIVELSSLCVSYGTKKVSELQEFIVKEEKLVNNRKVGITNKREKDSLFENLTILPNEFTSTIEDRVGVVIAGSAGGGIQSAAEMLTKAGILAGLHTSKKGEYPITVGTGFSVAEVILSKDPIQFTGLENPSVIVVVSEDGWNQVKNKVTEDTLVIMDNKLDEVGDYQKAAFSKTAGKKGAVLSSLAYWIKTSGIFPIDALEKVVKNHKHAESLQRAIECADRL